MDSFDPSSMRDSMKLDFGGGSTQVPTLSHAQSDNRQSDYKQILESPSFISLLNQISTEGKTAQEVVSNNTFKAPQYKPTAQLPTPTPTSLLFPDKVTNDQLQYAQGFLDALNHVQRMNNFNPPVLNSPSLLERLQPLVNCLSPQASPVSQPTRTATADFEAILSAINQKTEKESNEQGFRDVRASVSTSPPQPKLAAAAAVPVTSAAPAAALRPPPPPFFSSAAATAVAAAAAATAAPIRPPPVIPAAIPTSSYVVKRPPPSEDSQQNSSEDEDDSDSERSKDNGSAPPRNRSTVKKDLSGMDDQEAKKLERKRLRNRQAATKCRQKKLARISELEQQVNQEREHAKQLDYNLDVLRKQVRNLEQAIQHHAQNGCH